MTEQRRLDVLSNPELSGYHYLLKVLFDESKHLLAESEERILNLTHSTSVAMWVERNQKLLTAQEIEFEGKKMPLAEAEDLISELPTERRHTLHNLVMKKLSEISHFAEAEINAIYIHKKIIDDLRGFKNPFDESILDHEDDTNTVLRLVDVVHSNSAISHRFYELKARILGIQELSYADRNAKIGDLNGENSFEDAYKIVHEGFAGIDQKFVEVLERMASNGQIDVFPKKGKTGGAFCSHSVGLPTLVLLNHTPSPRSISTFGHEMGHAVHSELSKSQPAIYQHYSTSAAEVASTLCENTVFEIVFESLNSAEKIIALHDRINSQIATVFRQVACFKFELALHQEIRGKGAVTKERIAELHNIHMSHYLGPRFKLEELDGYLFVEWSHIRNSFYVYTYALGELVSQAIWAHYKEDNSFIKDIKRFLSSGGNKSPKDLFMDIGIDITDPNFFISGLKQIEKDIEKLEKLISKI